MAGTNDHADEVRDDEPHETDNAGKGDSCGGEDRDDHNGDDAQAFNVESEMACGIVAEAQQVKLLRDRECEHQTKYEEREHGSD